MKFVIYGFMLCVCVASIYAEIVAGVALRVNGHAITLYEIQSLQAQRKISRQAAIDFLINERLKDDEIDSLKGELSTKDKIIGRLQAEKEKIKQELQKFKGFWHSIMSHFHKRICYDKDNNYKIVSDDLYKNGIFDNNDNEIANNIARKVTIPDENKQTKNKKKNNDTRF